MSPRTPREYYEIHVTVNFAIFFFVLNFLFYFYYYFVCALVSDDVSERMEGRKCDMREYVDAARLKERRDARQRRDMMVRVCTCENARLARMFNRRLLYHSCIIPRHLSIDLYYIYYLLILRHYEYLLDILILLVKYQI